MGKGPEGCTEGTFEQRADGRRKTRMMLSWEECLKPRQWEELLLGDGNLDMNDHREEPQERR